MMCNLRKLCMTDYANKYSNSIISHSGIQYMS